MQFSEYSRTSSCTFSIALRSCGKEARAEPYISFRPVRAQTCGAGSNRLVGMNARVLEAKAHPVGAAML